MFGLNWFKKEKNKAAPQRLDEHSGKLKGFDSETIKILNLLNYTKSSGTSYNGEDYEVGYHSISLGGKQFQGQREPMVRLNKINYDFTNKTILDLGCNQGGMLFSLANKIKCGVGLDYDSRVINVANRIKTHHGYSQLGFYVFDLDRENLSFIEDFSPEKIDVCFLLSVCMWIKNWKAVIDSCCKLSNVLIFESNGKKEQQDEQINYLNTKYKTLVELSSYSDDDRQKKRKLYFCERD